MIKIFKTKYYNMPVIRKLQINHHREMIKSILDDIELIKKVPAQNADIQSRLLLLLNNLLRAHLEKFEKETELFL